MAIRTRPHVFIMSSSPGREIAEAIEKQLGADRRIVVRTWSGGEFKESEYFMESLRRAVLQFDFGISVVTPDDETKVVRGRKKTRVREPRDNVIFELGLFHAALGRRHAIVVAAEKNGMKPSLPTDLGSINRFGVKINSKRKVAGQVGAVCAKIKAYIKTYYREPGIGLLPASALAIGYYENFITPVVNGLRDYKACLVGERETQIKRPVEREDWRMWICIPEDLASATRDAWDAKAGELALVTGVVDRPPNATARPFPFKVDPHDTSGTLQIFDTPTTLKTVHEAVRELLPNDLPAEDLALAHERGIADFRNALAYLIRKKAPHLRQKIEIVYWGKLASRPALRSPVIAAKPAGS
jgi:CAP12/Pycsar effector protein, TIR domain/Prokaryotic STING domain